MCCATLLTIRLYYDSRRLHALGDEAEDKVGGKDDEARNLEAEQQPWRHLAPFGAHERRLRKGCQERRGDQHVQLHGQTLLQSQTTVRDNAACFAVYRWDNSTDASMFKLLVNKRSES